MADVKISKDLDNNKLIIEYTTNASKEKVWQAYSKQALFEKWWGPEGWETTTKVFDFRPGGSIHYGMKCVDKNQGEWFGQTSWGIMEISRVEDGSSFTFVDYFSDEQGTLNKDMPAMTVTNDFIERNGKTHIVATSLADSPEQIEQLINMGMLEGYSSQLNKLDQLLQS